MGVFQDRRASSGGLLFRKGSGKWVIAAIGLLLLLVWAGLESPRKHIIAIQELAPLEQVKSAVVSVSETLGTPVEGLPQPLQIRLETLFADIQNNPANKEADLREIRRVLHKNFKGQEDCWSCAGTEYFDRYDAIVGTSDSRKPIGLKEWIAMGDEAFDSQHLDDARENYSEALQIIDERAQADETIDPATLERMQARCLELHCR